MTTLVGFTVLLFLYSLLSRRLEQTVVTAPMAFTLSGMLMASGLPTVLEAGVGLGLFLRLAEIGLVMLLFTEASRTDLSVLRSVASLPVRLLSTGMLLTILLGALIAKLLFPHLSIYEAGILGAILAPTDAGLGQIIVNSPRVPQRIRQALSVEAGLNDGLAVPFLLFFIALAGSGEGHDARLTRLIVEQLGYGLVVGAGIGAAAGWLLSLAHRIGWMAKSFQQIGMAVVPMLCLLASEAVGASMFIAAFVAGLCVQIGINEDTDEYLELAEDAGQILNLSVFFLFGLLIVRDLSEFSSIMAVYAILSLTLVRMLPVALSLFGTGLQTSTALFMGWFGPRGLASIVLGLVYLEEEMHLTGETTIRLAVMTTVLLSILAHGLSALPGIAFYARKITAMPYGAPDRQDPVTMTISEPQ